MAAERSQTRWADGQLNECARRLVGRVLGAAAVVMVGRVCGPGQSSAHISSQCSSSGCIETKRGGVGAQPWLWA